MNDLKISCLSIDCPERTGGKCQFDPRSPILTPQQREARRVWAQVNGVIDEFGHDPEKCLDKLQELADEAFDE